MTLLIVFGSIAAYFVIGALIARVSIPAMWARVEKRYPHANDNDGDVMAGVVLRFLFWPLLGLFELGIRTVHAANPREQRRRIAEQAERIRELEDELGIEADR